MQGCWKKFAYCECLLVEHCCHTISGSFSQLLGFDEEMAVAHLRNLRGCQAEEISAAQVLNTLSVDHQQGLPKHAS